MRREDLCPVGQRGFVFSLPGRTGTARTHLDDLIYPGHFGGAAHGTAEAVRHTVHFITPIDMRIDLQDIDGSMFLESLEHHDGDGIIPTENDRKRPGLQDLLYRLDAARLVALRVVGIAIQITAVDHALNPASPSRVPPRSKSQL